MDDITNVMRQMEAPSNEGKAKVTEAEDDKINIVLTTSTEAISIEEDMESLFEALNDDDIFGQGSKGQIEKKGAERTIRGTFTLTDGLRQGDANEFTKDYLEDLGYSLEK